MEPLHAPGSREVYSGQEIRYILAHTPEEWMPLVALGSFTRLRLCEISRISWSAFHWTEKEIRISAQVAGKRGAPRNVPTPDNLSELLLPWRNDIGRLYDVKSDKVLQSEMRQFARDLAASVQKDGSGFKWKANALRFSFGSYHVALYRNQQLTRTIMGTSEDMLRHHYYDPQFRDRAEDYFNLTVARPTNVTALPSSQSAEGAATLTKIDKNPCQASAICTAA